MTALRIDERFRGPPTSGNGGYSAGLLAKELGGTGCVVTLRKPPPLMRDLRIEYGSDAVSLLCDNELIASAMLAPGEVEVPPPPSLHSAEAAQARYAGFCAHPFPGCFVCGTKRAADDGLRIFAGPLGDAAGQVAATWIPDESLADEQGRVKPEFLWAALDCPGYFAIPNPGPALLGRLGVNLHGEARVGEPLIVTAWPLDSEGRKHKVGTALHDRAGRLIAAALATWVSI